jgi:hypothetical protein
MEVLYKQNAIDTLYEIAAFIEGRNTKGSGYRFIAFKIENETFIVYEIALGTLFK